MVDELMQPLDEVDALDRFKDLSCGSEGNLIDNMAAYALAYKRQVRNCCKVRPTEKLIVDAFVAGIRYGRLKEHVNAKKAKTLDETIAEAFIQATEAEKARREHQRVERESATSATMTKAKEKSDVDTCWKRKRDEREGVKGQKYVHLNALVAEDRDNRPIGEVGILGRVLAFLYDTGASTDFISQSLVKELGLVVEPDHAKVKLATGTIYNSPGIVKLSADFGVLPSTGRRTQAALNLRVLPGLKPTLVMGISTLSALGLITIVKPTMENSGEPHFAELDEDEVDETLFTLAEAEHELQIRSFPEETNTILSKYKDVLGDISQPADVPPFELVLTNQKVINIPPYHVSAEEREDMQRQTAQLEDLNVIEESTSNYNNPTVLVWKRDRTRRLCLDFRRLNDATEDFDHDLPIIDDLVARLEGKTLFAKLDLSKAFHQIPMTKSSRRLTAFTVGKRKYQYKRLAFGLKGAAAFCQKTLESVLGDALWTRCLAYVDDIVIFGENQRVPRQSGLCLEKAQLGQVEAESVQV
ncbi:Aspartyl protease [Carpediemonas membranifera]|uniref:Aspartyl protease n=1 Tax=Carpediemonas membranifera TaxID=201153 RepID=A0A8J6C0E0_9EUKA|nr:Aspartyl protease [Carpediemonas membranifera]|eukprot:KAG9396486.1 Aspartyl protease [Carpediemonas membranifera]